MAVSYNPLFENVSGKIGPFVVVPDGDRHILRTRVYSYKRAPMQPGDTRWNVASIAGAWKTVPESERAQWTRLARLLWDAQGRPTPAPLRNYPLCLMLNLNRMAQNLPINMDAPAFPDAPPFVADVTLAASVPAPPPPAALHGPGLTRDTLAAFDGTALTVTLSGADYPHAVFVYGAKTTYGDDPAPTENKYVLLRVLPGISGSEPQAFGSEYAKKCGGAAAGGTLRLRLVPVSAAGFRGPARVMEATVTRDAVPDRAT